MDYVIWSLTILLLLAGLVGSVVPLLPGTTLILAGVLLQKWQLPGTLSWLAVGLVALFWLVSILGDFGCTLLGTRLFGGSKWGMAGASGGAMIGMFFSLPALILGTVLGAALAEKLGAKRNYRAAWRSGTGAAVGFLFGTVVRLGCAVVMLGIYLVAVWPARA